MIVVAGEVLVDLVVRPGGQVDARPGGGPYTAARTLARLGADTTFFGRVGDDGFGRLLRDRLTGEGVALGVPEPSARPSTLAVATLDEAGAASYSFYLDGTAASDLEYEQMKKALPPDLTAVHVGALGLVTEPIGTAIERVVLNDVPADALVLLDPNCRPGAIADPAGYRRRIAAIARRSDIVKASTEDLAYLYPGVPPGQAAGTLLAAGTALVLVTDGSRPVRAFLPGSDLPDLELTAEVPDVTVVDTIGAGDAFGGGFLAWWTAHGLGRAELAEASPGGPAAARDAQVGTALRAAAAVAALTCTRPGADPPTLAEVRSKNWWPEA